MYMQGNSSLKDRLAWDHCVPVLNLPFGHPYLCHENLIQLSEGGTPGSPAHTLLFSPVIKYTLPPYLELQF